MKKTLLLFGLTLGLNTVAAPGLWTNAKDKTLPTDFKIQGEYIGDLSCGCDIGAQVIALGGGEFQLPSGRPQSSSATYSTAARLAAKMATGRQEMEGKRVLSSL